MREGGLLRWQWALYPPGHQDRTNLAIHAATVPLFLVGTCVAASALWALRWSALAAGAALMVVALVAQARGHKREAVAPEPFVGPLDLPRRFFVEQWVTFPRFVFSGEFARSWRRAGRSS